MADLNFLTKQFVMKFDEKAFTEDNDYFYFKGYASVFGNIDLGGDVVMQGAFTQTLQERMPKLCYQHDIKDPIGVIIKCSEDSKGLYIEAKMPKANRHCMDIASLIKCGAIDSMSIGYATVDSDLINGVRYLKELKLYEISPVTLAMNEQARIDQKSVISFQNLDLADKSTAWNASAAIKRLQDFCKEPNDMYMKGFLWVDKTKSKSFEAYQLPIADIVDGKMLAIPRAIYAAAGVLQGTKSGIDIPSTDIDGIKMNLSKYYSKLEIVAPWDDDNAKSQAMIDAIETVKDVNEFLRTRGLNNIERTGIIAKIKSVAEESRNEKEMEEVQRNAEVFKSLTQSLTNLKAMISQ
jgi:HK97 family phage prohead protease